MTLSPPPPLSVDPTIDPLFTNDEDVLPNASLGPERGVHTFFSEQAARTPNAIALEFDDVQLTYRSLEQRANRLAHLLRRRGIEPDRRVAILMERSIPFVVSILATLKAGGAYVPLDPAYPADRLQMMLDESGATVLLTQASTRPLVTPHAGSGARPLPLRDGVLYFRRDHRRTVPL
jgi:non-ribosomal peptide synthetase component F